MKKTWIIILVLTMIMMTVLATGCGEKETPPADDPEPAAAEPADDGDDEMQKGGSGSSPLDGFDFEGANFKELSELSEADDAQFKGGAGNEESALDYR